MKSLFLYIWGTLWRFTGFGTVLGGFFGGLYGVFFIFVSGIMSSGQMPSLDGTSIFAFLLTCLLGCVVGGSLGVFFGMAVGLLEGSIFALLAFGLWQQKVIVPDRLFKLIGTLYGQVTTICCLVLFNSVIPTEWRYNLSLSLILPQELGGSIADRPDVVFQWAVCAIAFSLIGYLTASWVAKALRARLIFEAVVS